MGHNRVARHFTIIADTGQHSLLSYCSYLGLTVGVACWTIQKVYLVVQDAKVGYSLGPMEFCEWGDGSWGLIRQDIGAAGLGIPM